MPCVHFLLVSNKKLQPLPLCASCAHVSSVCASLNQFSMQNLFNIVSICKEMTKVPKRQPLPLDASCADVSSVCASLDQFSTKDISNIDDDENDECAGS